MLVVPDNLSTLFALDNPLRLAAHLSYHCIKARLPSMAPKTRATHLTPDSGTSTAIDNLTEPMGEIKARPREGSRTRGEDVVDPT